MNDHFSRRVGDPNNEDAESDFYSAEASRLAAAALEAKDEVLAECEAYFDNRADADQPAGADYPTPNDEMRLLTAIRGVK
jgi:hypothetical protein